jgi:hypothetical protein
MSDFDEVLHRIQNQLDKMKKSLRSHNRNLVRVATGEAPRKDDRSQSGSGQKNLPAEPPQKPPRR